MKLNESKNELAEIESLSRQPCPREALVYTITEAARTEGRNYYLQFITKIMALIQSR